MAFKEQQRTIWTVITTLVVIVLVVISVMAYQSVNKNNKSSSTNSEDVSGVNYEPNQAVKVKFTLPAISEGHYALWALTKDGSSFSVKQFRVDRQGFIVNLDNGPISSIFTTTGHNLSDVTSFIVTVERNDKEATDPSTAQILTTTTHQSSTFKLQFATDLSQASGSFILATPTNGQNSNETSGVWFTKLDGNNESAGLDLPAAPAGWAYQGWTVYKNIYLNIGRFTSSSGKDNFSNYSGPRSFPDFPGEDFLTNAPTDSGLTFPIDLADGEASVVVTLEPSLNDINDDPTGDVPFNLNVLRADIMPGAVTRVSINLANVWQAPVGTVQILTK